MREATTAKVLFVDDSGTLKRAIEVSLEQLELRELGRLCIAEDALRTLDEGNFETIVCDWRMPDIDGISLLTQAHEIYPTLRCILVTGFLLELQEQHANLPAWLEVVDKVDVDEEWLSSIFDTRPSRSIGVNDRGNPDRHDRSQPAFYSEFSGPADIIASQRLALDRLRGEKEHARRVVKELTLDLVEDLRLLGPTSQAKILGIDDRKISVGDLQEEIEHLTPEGRRLIELDRAVRRRLLQTKNPSYRIRARGETHHEEG